MPRISDAKPVITPQVDADVVSTTARPSRNKTVGLDAATDTGKAPSAAATNIDVALNQAGVDGATLIGGAHDLFSTVGNVGPSSAAPSTTPPIEKLYNDP